MKLLASLTNTYPAAGRIALRDGTRLCKLTKTDSAVLSWYLETQYVNEVAVRGYAVAPNLDVPTPSRKLTR